MRADDRTMTDVDADSTVKSVLSALKASYNAVMR
jgi:phenylalanyl-tRNA synthetase beta subunit